MVHCSPMPATCTAGHQRIALSSANSMQSWTGYDSSLDFVTDEYRAMQSPSLSCSDTSTNISSYFPIGCGSEPPLGFRSPLFLDAIREIDRLATNFLIFNSSSDLFTGSPESEWKSANSRVHVSSECLSWFVRL